MPTKADTFESYVNRDTDGDCWEWTGYRTLRGYGRYRRKLAHRVSYERSKGVIPEGLSVMHQCDNPKCVNPDHLSVGTHRDNMRDMIAKGRANRWFGDRMGEANPNAKLSRDDVRFIRSQKGQASRVELARKFGVCPNSISNVQNSVHWAEARHD